jgi:tRNA (guanine-N7-)-methyltransferase
VTKKKLIHFQENLTFPHLFQPSFTEIDHDFRLSSSWGKDFFLNDHPITLELGCGKGEYTVGLAEKYPEKNFIGIDFKGARLWRGSRTVQEKQMKNVAFIRTQVDHVTRFFGPGEVSEIWITFPDPQPNKERKRLTAPVFLAREIIGIHHHTVLFSTNDLYHSGFSEDVISIRTYYERKWLEIGKKICYLKFKLNSQ